MTQLKDLIQPAPLERCGDRSFPVLSMTMHDGIMLQSDRFKKSLASADQSAYKVVKRNQLVVGFPIDEGVLYIQQVADAGIMSPAYDVWNVDESKVDLQYFELCLHSPQSMMFYKSNLRGTTARRRSLPKDTLLSLPIPVPSIEKQQRIASTMGNIKALIDLRKQQLQKLDELVKARFVEMFGDPITNSKGLPLQKLGEICELQAGDFTAADDIHELQDESAPYPCYGGNGIRGYVDNYTQEGEFPIIGRQGALCGNVQLACGKFRNTEHAVLVTPKTELNRIWLFELLRLENLYRFHTGAAQPGLAVKTLNQVAVPTASIEQQNEYAVLFNQVDKSKLSIQASLDQLETLKQSLMQKYFG